jgi:hypothetical protein
MKTNTSLTWRERATQSLAETRAELTQLRGPNAQKFADSIGIGSHLIHSYTETLEAQERRLERELNPFAR